MLVRWCLDAVSMSRVLQFTVILYADVASLGAKTCHLACLLRPLSHLGGPSSDPGGLGSTRRETVGFQAWISVDFGVMTESTPRVIGVAVGKR